MGERLVCQVPQGHYQTSTVIAAVRLLGARAPLGSGSAHGAELVAALALAFADISAADCLGFF